MLLTTVHPPDALTESDIQELANLTAGDSDVDNFERLFTKLKEMKGKCDEKYQSKHILLAFQHVLCVCCACKIYTGINCIYYFQSTEKASSMPHEQRKVHAEKVNNCISHLLKKTQRQRSTHFVSWLYKI